MENLDLQIKEKIKKSRIFSLNNKTKLKEIFAIPNFINLNKLSRIIDTMYDLWYIEKKLTSKLYTKEERHLEYLNCAKYRIEKFSEIPEGRKRTDFRRIINIKHDSNCIWIKRTHKILNKILINILLKDKIRGRKQETYIPYLHSAVKSRSFVSNAKVHIGKKYVLAIDIKDFYPSVTKDKLYKFFLNEFKLEKDIAMIYSIISTVKDEDNVYKLGQGFSQSATLAYLVNYSLFNHLYNYANDNNINMTVYVDDVVFSSNNPIPQQFISRLFKVMKQNGMEIKREKLRLYCKSDTKKITGVLINNKKLMVPSKKHEEMLVQYKQLLNSLYKVDSIDDYFNAYNLYLKFSGNYQYVSVVESKANLKYKNFIKHWDYFFPKGIKKVNSRETYNKKNIKNGNDKVKFNQKYKELLSAIHNGSQN